MQLIIKQQNQPTGTGLSKTRKHKLCNLTRKVKVKLENVISIIKMNFIQSYDFKEWHTKNQFNCK